MQPQQVNPGNFQVERIIYNQNGFAIAVGIWVEDGTRRFAMRWNDSPTIKGYPSVFNNPMWFQLTDDIQGVINTLISNSNIEVRP